MARSCTPGAPWPAAACVDFAGMRRLESPRLCRQPSRPMPTPTPSRSQLRRLVETAMDLERRTMQLYCVFESQFAASEELRAFWFDMARHESRHFGGLALVGGLLEGTSGRPMGTIAP